MIDNSLQYNEILFAQRYLQDLQYQHWLQYELYTSQWWCLVAVLIIPWLIWWRIVDKKKTAIILAYGLYIDCSNFNGHNRFTFATLDLPHKTTTSNS